METIENNILIAKYLGWNIESEISVSNNIETLISKNKGLWDSTVYVSLDNENYTIVKEQKINELFGHLCNPKYGKVSGFTKNIAKIFEVIEQIEKDGFNFIIERDFVTIKITSESKFFYEKSICYKKRNQTKEEASYELIIDFIKKYF